MVELVWNVGLGIGLRWRRKFVLSLEVSDLTPLSSFSESLGCWYWLNWMYGCGITRIYEIEI